MLRLVIASLIGMIAAVSSQPEACCQLGGTRCGDATAVSCNNGAVCFPPFLSCPSCTCTTTLTGQSCLPTSWEPGTVSTFYIDKSVQTPGNLDLRWGATCTSTGPDYSVHEGQLGVWFSHHPVLCTTGHTLAATITPSGGGRYYLIAPIWVNFTGGFGTDSTGAQRPNGNPSCTGDRAIVPCP